MKISIIGTVGVPGRYGGFETLAENLVRHHAENRLPGALTVYCSRAAYPEMPPRYLSARLRYSRFRANGLQSVPYDMLTLLDAVFRRADTILLLGVSGAAILPLVRLVSSARIITNVDGIEWKRNKWRGVAKWFLRFSEKMAARYSHEVIADNQGIADHIEARYNTPCRVIAYGGDHALSEAPQPVTGLDIPDSYAFALCRIEPENNVEMILEAVSALPARHLVFVGNWKSSAFGQNMLARFGQMPNLNLLDPIYELGKLRTLRAGAEVYIHGHSAGGTNPSLVEMMHFGLPVLAFDCVFNRFTTDGKAAYFSDAGGLARQLSKMAPEKAAAIGADMARLAQARYTWAKIGEAYFGLLTSEK